MGVIVSMLVAIACALGILLFPFSKKSEVIQRYGRIILLAGMVIGIVSALIFALL